MAPLASWCPGPTVGLLNGVPASAVPLRIAASYATALKKFRKVAGCTGRPEEDNDFALWFPNSSQKFAISLLGILAAKPRCKDFEDWFFPVLWDLAEERDSESRRLAGSISNMMAECSRGDRSEGSLRAGLADELRIL